MELECVPVETLLVAANRFASLMILSRKNSAHATRKKMCALAEN